MKSLLSFFVVLVLFAQNIFSAPEKLMTSSPIMKIRFNATEVSYQNKLENILDKIFEINKDAKFLLVSIEKTSAKAEDKEFSKRKIQEVSKILLTNGVSEKNIEYKFLTDKNVLNNEIHIFLSATNSVSREK
jgi:hypothetical protein